MKDRIWFFGAFDRVKINQTQTTLDPDEHRPRSGSEFPIDLFQNKYSGKLTFNILQGTSIVGSVFSDAQTQDGHDQRLPDEHSARSRMKGAATRAGRTTRLA